jgi:type II secretory pathway pseudopilin PulG
MPMSTGFTRKDFIVVLVIFGALVALLLPAILKAHEAARASTCLGHMSQLKHGVETYRDTHGRFPPAFFVDEASKAEHSWRVAVLPFIANSNDIDQYRFQENWDSEHNLKQMDQLTYLFQCPSRNDIDRTQFTNYVCVQGEETIFPKGKSIKLDDVSDGAENAIVLVEAHGLNIHWREPRDLEFTNMSFELNDTNAPSINSPHPTGPVVSFADKSYRRLANTVTGTDVKALLTRAAGDSPKRAELDKDGMTMGR